MHDARVLRLCRQHLIVALCFPRHPAFLCFPCLSDVLRNFRILCFLGQATPTPLLPGAIQRVAALFPVSSLVLPWMQLYTPTQRSWSPTISRHLSQTLDLLGTPFRRPRPFSKALEFAAQFACVASGSWVSVASAHRPSGSRPLNMVHGPLGRGLTGGEGFGLCLP